MGLLNSTADKLGVSVSDITSIVQEFTKASDPDADAATLVSFGETLAELAEKANLGNTQFKEYILNLVDTALEAETTEERARLLEQAMEDLAGAVSKSDDKAVSFVLRMEQMAKEAGKTREEILKMQAAMIEDPVMRERAEAAIKIIEDQRKAEEAAKEKAKKDAEAKRDADKAAAREKKRIAEEDKVLRAIEDEQKRKEDKAAEDRERRIEKEKELRVKDVLDRRQEEKDKRDDQIKMAEEGFAAIAKYNKTAFEAHKVYASGKAVMDTYAAANNALASIPFPFNLAVAAGIVAGGLANVATIQSQQYQGRALGGQVRGGQTYVVGERGPELLTMGGNGTVTPNEKLRGATGTQSVSETVNINFQITANDASGFDQLLVARRGMIVSMINQAMNNRGRRGLV
jgi:hypothetical protein